MTAKLQAFPDNWQFMGSKTQCYRQIGNALPSVIGNEEGWPIRTNNDLANLKPGEYMLESVPPDTSYKFQRGISKRVRAQVLDRNGYTCQMCGAKAGDPDELNPGRTVLLHLGTHSRQKSGRN